MKVGVQLIIWGERGRTNFTQVLDEIASIGYEGIEAGVPHFENVSDPKAVLSTRGLLLAGLHMNVGSADTKAVDEAVSLLGKTGGHYLLFSGAGGKENSDENYVKNAARLEEFGKLAKKQGVMVCYHNHWQEIVDDARGTRIILENTSPEHVSLCVDTYWVKCGGMSPVEFIKEYGDRVAYLHLKDGTEEGMKTEPRKFLELGQGIIDFPAIIKAAEPLGVEWLVVEQDRTERTPKESMAMSRKYLKENLGYSRF